MISFDDFKKLKEENYEWAKGYLRYNGKDAVGGKSVYVEEASEDKVFVGRFHHYYGLSINDKIYHSSRCTERTIYDRKKGTITYITAKKKGSIVRTPILWVVQNIPYFKPEIIKDYPFLEWAFQSENLQYVKHTLNWLVRRKISSFKKYLKVVFPKIPTATVIKALKNVKTNQYNSSGDIIREIKEAHKWVENVEHFHVLAEKLAGGGNIKDIKFMCLTTQTKVNALWSDRRINEFHDDVTKLLNKKKLEYFLDAELKIPYWAKDLKLLPGQELVTSRKRLVQEGKEMNHCVASYEGKIISGSCIIICGEINGTRYTMQVNKEEKNNGPDGKIIQLKVVQNYSVGNKLYPERDEINKQFEEANISYDVFGKKSISYESKTVANDDFFDVFEEVEEGLPF